MKTIYIVKVTSSTKRLLIHYTDKSLEILDFERPLDCIDKMQELKANNPRFTFFDIATSYDWPSIPYTENDIRF